MGNVHPEGSLCSWKALAWLRWDLFHREGERRWMTDGIVDVLYLAQRMDLPMRA